ncbi:NAD(P)/FAD-dependent oxidoreductase [Niallia sp. FSL W8-0635]|uniref:NAD(P)/FAD-dependent oxidoreductase n=1 Tax=Niallia sp. FSL W8-0635 TaxID=2975337 RepID=UPI0009C76B4C|nr:glycine/D-amino acid oxidase, deaminating [Mycobacteroides abscessus subsp. abscessus]HEO8420104.1 FAD-binding oxidoreductase [Yersinia enterocolitica]
MSLYHGSLYWPTTIKDKPKYPKLNKDRSCEVLIIGAGMSGALLTYKLAKESLDVILVDKDRVGNGSSSANTGLLQYSNDKMLHSFAETIGVKDAVRFYRLCFNGMEELKRIAETLQDDIQFENRQSLYYASTSADILAIKKEYDMLKKYDFPIEFLDEDKIYQSYGFKKHAAIRTSNDAEVNPQKLVISLIKEASQYSNVQVFEKTEVQKLYYQDGYWLFKSEDAIIRAKHVVYATGYESDAITMNMATKLNRTYVIVTNPVSSFQQWEDRCLIWETKRPYFYMRTTYDGRIVAGGLDEEMMEAPKDPKILNGYANNLLTRIKEHFPQFQLQADYVYGATFGESVDGIPFIGEDPKQKNLYYCLGFGGNGTVYSAFGSTIIKELITKGEHPDADLVRLDR